MRDRRQSKGKTIRPTFFVFCEGESEEAYIKFLRSKYRLPIEICPSVAGLSINNNHIKNFKKERFTHPKDRDYLVYDLDRDGIMERLKSINGARIIATNPCLELWFLLHYVKQTAVLTSAQCVSLLKRHAPQYKKGGLCASLITAFESNQWQAVERARALPEHKNPSSDMPLLIADIEAEREKEIKQ